MSRKTLIIAASPRKKGNTDILAQWACDEAQVNDFDSEIIYLRNLKFSSCIACDACFKDGQCHVRDDLQGIYPKIIRAEKIVFVAPIFFQALGAIAKALIDRTQCYWAAHFVLQQRVVVDDVLRAKRGLYGVLCGATNLKDTFTCGEKSLQIFASSIEAPYQGGSFFPRIDKKGDIEKISPLRKQFVTEINKFFTDD